MLEIEKLPGLPDGEEVLQALVRICNRLESLGVDIVDDYSIPEHARFIGIFEANTITLYPQTAPRFARWFTVAHLYGHMVQLLNETERVRRANSLVLRLGETLTAEDVQVIYDHEREAAEIGRRLIAETEAELSLEMDRAYCRFFHADFRYLVNVIETKEGGEDAFARYWKREPVVPELIVPDAGELVNFKQMPPSDDKIVVI